MVYYLNSATSTGATTLSVDNSINAELGKKYIIEGNKTIAVEFSTDQYNITVGIGAKLDTNYNIYLISHVDSNGDKQLIQCTNGATNTTTFAGDDCFYFNHKVCGLVVENASANEISITL